MTFFLGSELCIPTLVRCGVQVYWWEHSLLKQTGPVFAAGPVCTWGCCCALRDKHTFWRTQGHTAFMGQSDHLCTWTHIYGHDKFRHILTCSICLFNMARKQTQRIVDNGHQNSFLTTEKKNARVYRFLFYQ